MYSSDRSISNIEDDILGRGDFAKELAKSIISLPSDENFAIGLYGGWGCGKTSIINMALTEIKRIYDDKSDDQKPLIIEFNPWNYSDNTQIINQFFLCLKKALNERSEKVDSKLLQDLGSVMERYSSALDFATMIPGIGLLSLLIKNVGTSFYEEEKAKAADLSIQKDKIISTLSELKFKIIIVIDDIDRLSNEQIKMIFQLVNNVAGFPNVVYLLSFDKNVVVRALSNVQDDRGEGYLQKIIQIPFEIPTMEKSKIESILINKLSSIIEQHQDSSYIGEYWINILNTCVIPYINTIRDINRLSNAFLLKYNLVHEETNVVDLLAITSIQTFRPEIASWIYDNKNTLCGGNKGATKEDIERKKEDLTKIFEKDYKDYPEMMDIISSLFPSMYYTNIYSEQITNDMLRREQRLASEHKFDLYYVLSLEKIKISRTNFDKSIHIINSEDLSSFINDLFDKNIIVDYLQELESNITRIPKEGVSVFISMLLQIIKKFYVDIKISTIYAYYPNNLCKKCLALLLKQITQSEAYEVIKKEIVDLDKYGLTLFAFILDDQETINGKLTTRKLETLEAEVIFSRETLPDIRKGFLDRLKVLIKDDPLLDWSGFPVISYLWESFDKTNYKEYLTKLFSESPINILKFIAWYLSERQSSLGDRGWKVWSNEYTSYLANEEIVKAIETLCIKNEFWNLDESIKEKVATFYILNNDDSKDDINIEDANKLLDKWKQNILANSEGQNT